MPRLLKYDVFGLRQELTEPAGCRGDIGPPAGLVILELTEPADRPAVARPMLRFFEFNLII